MQRNTKQQSDHRLPWFYHFANWVLRNVLFKLLLRVDVYGLEHVPPTGPLIVAVNHISFLDPPLAGAYIPRDLHMMAKIELFKIPLVRHVIRGYGAFPIRRGEGDAQALKYSLRTLKSGGVVFLAPEGTRSPTKQLQRGKEGVALLAARTGTPILPVGISGQDRWLRALSRGRRARVAIRIGEPFVLDTPDRRPDRATLTAMTDAIMQRLAAQLPVTYRGEYAVVATPDRYTRPVCEHDNNGSQ